MKLWKIMNFFINYEGNYEEQRIVYFKKVCCYNNYIHRKKCTAAKSAMISDKHRTADARKGRTTAPWKTWVDKKDTFWKFSRIYFNLGFGKYSPAANVEASYNS